MTTTDFSFVWKKFNELSADELYLMLKLRQAVFIVEQKCPYHDMDGVDQQCLHLMVRYEKTGDCVGTERIVPPGKNYEGPAIGRVAVDMHFQGHGLGRKMMEEGIAKCEKLYPGRQIHLGAQRYLKKFYESLGFEDQKLPYLEDGVPHLYMVRKA
jgi:ElaA protein